MDLREGIAFGRYQLEKRLGAGGFGSVWRARDSATGQTVALKIFTGDTRLQPAGLEQAAGVAAALSAHVVGMLASGIEPTAWVAMEFVDGVDLAAELHRRGRLEQREVIRIGEGIADGLAALARVGIVHRDVKPANVMLGGDGTVKLTDFGIAKDTTITSITATGDLALSMGYAAPEVWDGRASSASDMYALGVVLYQCLTGVLPFGGSYAQVYRGHLSLVPDWSALPIDLVPSLHALIQGCLAKDPSSRPGPALALELLNDSAAEIEHPSRALTARSLLQTPPSLRTYADRRRAEADAVTRIESALLARGYAVARDVAVEGLRFDLVTTRDGRRVFVDGLAIASRTQFRQRRTDLLVRARTVNAATGAPVVYAVIQTAGVALDRPFVAAQDAAAAVEGEFATATLLATRCIAENAPEIFVAMPFSRVYTDVYNVGIRGAARAVRASAFRVDHSGSWTDIVQEIHDHVKGASLVVADLSGARPNVLYEVGYAHACGKTVVLITSDTASAAPFDVAHVKIHEYDIHDTMRLRAYLRRVFREELRKLGQFA